MWTQVIFIDVFALIFNLGVQKDQLYAMLI